MSQHFFENYVPAITLVVVLVVLIGGLVFLKPHRAANLAADCAQREGLWLADHEICLSREELQLIRGER